MEKKYDLISAIFIAKSIIDNNLNLITSIQHDRQYLGTEKFDINKQVKLHTCIRPFIGITRKLLLKHTGLDKVDLKIHLVDTSEYNHTGSTMAGIMIKESETSYGVLLNKGETYCTQRLSLCKELAEIWVSCMINDPVPTIKSLDPNSQMIEAIRELVLKFYSSSKTPKLTDKFDSTESFAHAIALELMIPYKLRDEIDQEIKKRTPVFQIAQRLWITEETLDEYIKSYFHITTPIYTMLKSE